MSDDGAGFKDWTADDLPDALRLNCFQPVGRELFHFVVIWIKFVSIFALLTLI